MEKGGDKPAEVVRFLQKTVEKLTPAVTDVVMRKTSGHFEVHFDKGEFTRAFRKDGL